MKRKRQARILLGFLLAALLMLPGGMRTKAEEVVTGEQPTQEALVAPEEVKEEVEGLEEVETKDPEIKDPPPEGDEEKLPEEIEPEKNEEEPEPGPEEPLLEDEDPVEEDPVEEEKPAVEEKLIESEEEVAVPDMKIMTAPPDVPELDLKSFDCDFIWGVDYGDKLFDFDCDCDIGPKIGWFGIKDILGKHIKFLPKVDVKCITVEKIWLDGGSKDRPCFVLFDLYAGDKKVAVLPIVSGTWKTKILVPSKIHGKEITYSVKEHTVVKGYDSKSEGLKIINTKTRDITVEKSWLDDHESIRPDSVNFWLMNGDMKVGGLRTITSAEGWKEVIENIPAYDMNGKIEYTIMEEPVMAYESEVVEGCYEGSSETLSASTKCCEPDDECPDFTIVNTFKNEKELHLVKKWVGDDPEDRPDALTFVLSRSDGTSVEIPVTAAMGWEKDVMVEVYDEMWAKFDYELDEKEVPDGYVKSIEDFTITNKLKEIIIPEKIKIEGEKTWIDKEDDERPEFIMVKLMGDGKLVETMKVEPDEGKWMYSFTELPKYDEEMNVIEYEVVEEPVEGYMSEAGEAYDIINKKAIEVSGEKTWLDDGTGRPEFIMVKLMGDGELLTTKKVMPDEEDKWLYDFGMLPKYNEEMDEIDYTVSEEPVEGYELIAGEGYDITNRRTGMITISGEKTWDDLMNRPDSITVYLDRDGERFDEVEVKADEDGKWLYSFKETAQFDEEGMPYDFTVSEKYILGYEAEVDGYDILNVQLTATMRVLKVNEADKPLAGAVFEVRDISGKVLKTFTTGADGLFSMELPLGMYRLVEISPPSGYAKNSVPKLVILFKAGEVKTVEIVNEVDEFDDISPKPIPTYPTLPKTGAGSEMGFYFFGFASVAAGLLTIRKKKN